MGIHLCIKLEIIYFVFQFQEMKIEELRYKENFR